ncbi:hypothetical protein ACQEU3_31410 [Spirillospora sp. CA-253888]
MIILSGVLVLVAIALLVAGIVAGNGDSAQVLGVDALIVIYTSIAVSVVSFLCLAIGVFLRRKEIFGTGSAPARDRRSKKDKKDKKGKKGQPATTAAASRTAAPSPAKDDAPADDEVEIPAPPMDVPEEALVYVIRGRKRYHLDTCRQLAGRDKEDLTYIEAKEEGFTPCTACMPDTALAARAAVSAPAVPAKSGASGKARARAGGPAVGTPVSAPMDAPAKSGPSRPSGSGKPDLAKPDAGKPAAASGPAAPAAEPGAAEATRPLDHAPAEPAPLPSAWPAPGGATPAPVKDTALDLPIAGAAAKAARPAEEKATRSAGGAPAPDKPSLAKPSLDKPAEGTPARDRAAGAETVEKADTKPFGEPADDLGAAPSAPRPRRSGDAEADEAAVPEPKAADAKPADVKPAEPQPAEAKSVEVRPADAVPADAVPTETKAAEAVPAEAESGAAQDGAPPADDQGPQVRILSGTKRYHRTDCALIEDIGDEADDLEALSRAEAKARGCTPCLVCQPDREHARD